MDRYHKETTLSKVEGKDVIKEITNILSHARYLDDCKISIAIDGEGKGRGTVDSSTYSIVVSQLEDCITY